MTDHRPAPAVPRVTATAPTPADVAAYPAHYTDCAHGYRRTDSCPCCDAEDEQAVLAECLRLVRETTAEVRAHLERTADDTPAAGSDPAAAERRTT